MLRALKCRSVLVSPLLVWLVCTIACGRRSEQSEVSKIDSAGLPAAVLTADLDLDLTGLDPRLRDKLKEIKVLIIRDANVADIWSLPDQSRGPDIVILACSADLLSTDMLFSLRKWASESHGIMVTQRSLVSIWPYFSPQALVPYFSGSGIMTVIEGSIVTEHVSRVQRFPWCSADSNSTGIRIKRADQELGHDEISQALAIEREKFIPVVVQSHYDTRGDRYRPFQLFATTWKGARIAWLSSDLPGDPASGCELLFDDARLWSNLVHWLAGK